MDFKVSFWKKSFRLLMAITVALCLSPSTALATDISTNTINNTDITNAQQKFTAAGKTLTNNALINRKGNNTVFTNSKANITIINNVGAVISTDKDGTKNNAIKATSSTSTTITNSGTISSENDNAIKIDSTNSGIITNNAGGLITANDVAIYAGSSTGLTITNSGTISVASPSNTAINLINSTGATLTLKDEGIIVGKISFNSTTNSKLQLDHGFGRAYFYETSGDFTLEDLSGNKVVKGSAGSVGLGGQETVDELLGLRTYNLRSVLKRYASAPKPTDDMVWGETFGYSSKRGGTDTILKYDTYGYGMNFIHPVTSKLDLILSVERNELDFPEKHDVSRTGFIAGVNVSEFSGFGKGNWKAGGFAVAGMGWHNSKREILTNTTSSGFWMLLLIITA